MFRMLFAKKAPEEQVGEGVVPDRPGAPAARPAGAALTGARPQVPAPTRPAAPGAPRPPAPAGVAAARPAVPAAAPERRTGERRRNLISAPPAPEGSGRLYELRQIDSTDELAGGKVLTAEDGPLPIGGELQDRFALVESEPKRIVLIFTNNPSDIASVNRALVRAGDLGYELIDSLEAPASVIHLFYDTSTGGKTSDYQYRGKMDDLFDSILQKALIAGASDIHLEVQANRAEVKLRVNGDLRPLQTIRRDQAETLSNSMYTFCEEDTRTGQGAAFDQKGFQDARITRKIEYKRGDEKVETAANCRFASQVVVGGWDITLRVLPSDADTKIRSTVQLGYNAIQDRAIERMMSAPTGLISLVGSTGSGKSTTLQTLLDAVYRRYGGRRKVRTIEDPPEYHIPGARQTPAIKSEKGNGFVPALKACLRGDPDIILIGEVRDEETARLMQQAVQTGHKVFTTVHASSPFDAVERLIDLGIRRNVMAGQGFLSGIIYQKLLPVLCSECSVELEEVRDQLSGEFLRRLHSAVVDTSRLRFRGGGCQACGRSGIVARTVAASMFVPDRHALQFIRQDDLLALSAYWRAGLIRSDIESNGITELDQAIQKMATGLISPLDVEEHVGNLDSQESREQARRWIEHTHPHLVQPTGHHV